MRFHNIQIVRLVAAVGVAVIHLAIHAEEQFGAKSGSFLWLRLPWLASFLNPLFFAVSGFVLAHVLQATPPGRFMVNRAVRLYPGYWLALAVVTGSCAAGLWPGPYHPHGEPAPTLETVLVVPPTNVRLGQYPLQVEWTLVYEVVLWVGLLGLWLAAGKKRLPWAVAGWLAVLAVKSVVRPDYGSRPLPSWKSVWVSVFVAPFLLGVLAYYLRTRGRNWRWAVLALVVGLNAVAATVVPVEVGIDAHYWLRSVAAGLTLWLLVQIPDAAARNPLVVGGGYSYGLYLLHVPLMLFAFRVMQATGWWVGTPAGVVVAGVWALSVGLAFGRLELALHGRLKKLQLKRAAGFIPAAGRRMLTHFGGDKPRRSFDSGRILPS